MNLPPSDDIMNRQSENQDHQEFAFESLPEGVLEFLLRKDNVETLESVIRHHIVADFEISSANIVNNGGKVTTIDGDTLSILTMNQTTPTIGDSTGSEVRSTFASFDITGTNGVTHLLDRVLIPAGVSIPGTIIDTATTSASFPTLLEGLTVTGLIDTLNEIPGPFTVFAPSELAWEKLTPGTVETLLTEENRDNLPSLLLYHVIGDIVTSEDILEGGSISTSPTLLAGETLEFTVAGRGDTALVKVDTANLVFTDIATLNGVIHVIDDVLLPKDLTIPLTVLGTLGRLRIFESLLAAIDAADLAEILSASNPLSKYERSALKPL